MELRSFVAILLLAGLTGLPFASLAQSRGANDRVVYCCTDDNGRPICGDVFPRQCIGKAYREMTSQGVVRREVAAPLTAEQRRQREIIENKRQAEREREEAQHRLDVALFESYPNIEAIDEREQRELAEVARAENVLLERMQGLEERRAGLVAETEFYKEREVPNDITAAIAALETEIATYGRLLEAKKKEGGEVRARYETDRVRYRDLLNRGFSGLNR